ncbi:hypothetical protein [Flaviflexus huanghaiensis]|uniref:hypothetical protein n=1 Tax=Flaviflexus huanghaiensis TaxID=1111473 RepID=UPI0015FA8C69|nr:hypothetical protein [Flaviflexus huanghaiensis]
MAENGQMNPGLESYLGSLDLTDLKFLSLSVDTLLVQDGSPPSSKAPEGANAASEPKGEFNFAISDLQVRESALQVSVEATVINPKVRGRISIGAAFQSRADHPTVELDEKAQAQFVRQVAFPHIYPHLRAIFPPLFALAGHNIPMLPMIRIGDFVEQPDEG